MGIASAWSAWRAGKSSDEIFGLLALSEADIERGKAADSKIDQQNRALFERGVWDQTQFDQAQANAQNGTLSAELNNPETSILQGFKDGWVEGAQNEQNFVKKAITVPLNFGLGMIPWQVWVGLGVYVLWRLGWLEKWLKAK
jgi:hypothetical protein